MTTDAYQVAAEQCSTCIFGPKTPLTAERFKYYHRLWERKGFAQECHMATGHKLHIGCRGHYEAWKRGAFKNHPLRIIARDLGLPDDLRNEQLARLFESLGHIIFVQIPKEP